MLATNGKLRAFQLNVYRSNVFTTYGQDRTSSFYDIAGTNQTTTMRLRRIRIGNPDAKWEKNIKSNIEIGASLFKGRLDVTKDLKLNATVKPEISYKTHHKIDLAAVNVLLTDWKADLHVPQNN